MDAFRLRRRPALLVLRWSIIAILVLTGLTAVTQNVAAQPEPDALPHWLYLPQVVGGSSASRDISTRDSAGNADVVSGVMCMEEEAGFGLNCTANDVSIANATNITILDDGCAYPGDTVTFKADFEVLLTAEYRHDVGLWFAADGDPNGDGARTGSCTAATPAYAPDPPWLDLDGTNDPLPKDNKPSGIQDTCGDINDDHNPLYPSVTLTVQCIDTDANGKLELPNCTSWRQPGDNDLCTTPKDAVPGAPSKCKCDPGFDIDIPVPGQIKVDKVTIPADATVFNFTLTGGPSNTNLSFSLADASPLFASQNLMAGTYSVVETANGAYGTTAVCSDGSPANAVSLQAGEIVTCTFTNRLLEKAPSILVTKTANPTEVAEPGGSVNFTVAIKNTSDATDPVTITSLNDDVHGDLDGQGTCLLPVTIQPGATWSCMFSANVTGVPGYVEKDTVTAAGADNEGVPVSGSDDATVTITDVLPDISITKTANPTSVSEMGGNVLFTFVVTNNSSEAAAITKLEDSRFGALAGDADCQVNTILAGGASCDFQATFAIPAADYPGTHVNTFTAEAVDNEGNKDTATDDETVTYTDVPGTIDVVKTADRTTVDEPGGDVVFTFVVYNTSSVDAVTISSLIDSIYGDLDGKGTCDVPQTIAVGGEYSCSATFYVGGEPGDNITNVVTASGTDDDGKPVSDTDDETVTINGLESSIEMVKTANPSSVKEPGGDVTFSFEVKNTSAVDEVTINSLTDTVYGDMTDKVKLPTSTCTVPQDISAGGSYVCSFTVFVDGNANYVETNVATASGKDDDGNTISDDDDATVTIENIPSAIELLKTADPETVNEPGGNVTFSFVVNNLSEVDTVTINSLTDSVYGDLTAVPGSTCSVSQVLPPEGSYSCAITVFVGGDAGASHTNTATASGMDDDGQIVGDDDSATVTVNNVQGAIEVVKTASPTHIPEPGGNVEFTIIVYNLSTIDTVTLNSLIDSVYGDLNGQGDCVLPQTIALSGFYSCTFTGAVSGNANTVHTNVVTASGKDDDNDEVSDTDDATVTVTDLPSSIELVKTASAGDVPEPGDYVTFSFEVKNTSAVDTVTINSLTDTVYMDLTQVPGSTCVVPQTLIHGASYSCSITVYVSGNYRDVHYNKATATGVDDDGKDVSASDDETVTITDVPSSIQVTKSASPSSVPETGGNVLFTVVVKNTSLVDTVTINSVSDVPFGDVSTFCSPALPARLLPDEKVTCAFTKFISGQAGQKHTDVATGSGVDDDGFTVEDDDEEEVPFEDVLPDISVTKTANPTAVPETGGDVLFTFVVTNNGAEAVTITSLSDDKFGALAGDADCAKDTLLAAGASCTFSATFAIPAGDVPGSHVNTFTAVASDDDGNSDSASDDATVDYTDVLPDISVTKTANPTAVPETGGDVLFTFVVTNNGAEAATITSLSDDKFGALAGDADCAKDTLLAAGASCTFSATFAIPAGDVPGSHTNTFTAVAADDDGNSDSDNASATVTYTDVLPDISVTKAANPTSVPQIGGNVLFTFVVKNNGAEAAAITSLADNPFGTLAGDADCKVGTVLLGGASCEFSATFTIPAGPYPGSHTNTFTAVAEDDEGNKDTATDDETVTYTFIDYGQIAPTGVTCAQYVNGTAPDFSDYYAYQGGVIQYGVKSNKISQTNPGVFFYYTGLSKTLAGSGPRTIYVDQNDNSNVVGAFTTTKTDIKLWLVTGSTCTQVQLGSSQITLLSGPDSGDVRVNFTAAAPAGSYYVLSVKYATSAVIGTNLGNVRPTVQYKFTTDFGDDGTVDETDIKGITLAPK